MECPVRARDGMTVLLDYCARKLDRDRAEEVDAHIATCAPCREWVTAQQAVWSALDEWTPPAVSTDFNRRLYAKIGEERPGWKALLWPWRSVQLRPAFSLVMVFVFALAVLLTRTPHPSLHHQQIEALDVDHLERTLDDVEMLRQLAAPPSVDVQPM